MEKINNILNQNLSIYDLVLQDISQVMSNRVSQGMTAEQVLRTALIKPMMEVSYEELEFHMEDSITYRWFCYNQERFHQSLSYKTPDEVYEFSEAA